MEESETLTKVEAGIIEENPNSVRYKIYEKYSGQLDKLIEPQVYLHLGHFQLLLNRFDDALSAYLKFESLCPKESSINCPFLYGLGLCCFRFNVFNRYATHCYFRRFFVPGLSDFFSKFYIYNRGFQSVKRYIFVLAIYTRYKITSNEV